jgi:small-conductance mechanosensitive channel
MDEAVEPFMMFSEALLSGLRRRLLGLSSLPSDGAAYLDQLESLGWSPSALAAAAFAVVVASFSAIRITRIAAVRAVYGSARTGALSVIVGAMAALIVGWLVAVGLSAYGPVRDGLIPFALVVPVATLLQGVVRWIIGYGEESGRGLRRFADDLGHVLRWAALGAAVTLLLRRTQASAGIMDVWSTFILSPPIPGLIIWAYWRSRAPVARSLFSRWRGRRWARQVAVRWPAICCVLAILALLISQIVATVGRPLPVVPGLVTFLLLVLSPHLDVRIAKWADAGLIQSKLSAGAVAFRRTMRLAAFTLVVVAVLAVWSTPIAVATGMTLADTLRPTLAIGGIILVSAYLLNLIGVTTDRLLAEESPGAAADEELGAPRSRIATILPLLEGAAKIAIMALTGLTVLLTLGVNVWPLVTGLSVFGLAIGFGSQTLVKDIVSGLFFLFDDAFRLGEYIETSGAKGTVEKISVRSVSLRHPRGAVATIPYGQIGKITNHSRDWVIEKIAFRVAFDTDVDQVRKMFKAIGQELMDDPELREDLIEPFKSQGIAEVEDGTLVIRGKFKAKAGRQYNMRKAVLAAVHKAFRENGIKAVPRPLAPQAAA